MLDTWLVGGMFVFFAVSGLEGTRVVAGGVGNMIGSSLWRRHLGSVLFMLERVISCDLGLGGKF
jgi:hypothetical protein